MAGRWVGGVLMSRRLWVGIRFKRVYDTSFCMIWWFLSSSWEIPEGTERFGDGGDSEAF